MTRLEPLDVIKDAIAIGLVVWLLAAIWAAIEEPSWSSIGTVAIIAGGGGVYWWRAMR